MFDTLPILIILIALPLATGWYAKSVYRRYSKVALATEQTGAEVAQRIVDSEGLHKVGIELTPGHLTDHYDPRADVIRLSEEVYHGRTVSAAGIAAHEAGHAAQHAQGHFASRARQIFLPSSRIGSMLALLAILGGFFTNRWNLFGLGVVMFAAAVLFKLVTLPVEFDASRRALAALNRGNALPTDQVRGARTVLTAAALSHIAHTLIAVISLTFILVPLIYILGLVWKG